MLVRCNEIACARICSSSFLLQLKFFPASKPVLYTAPLCSPIPIVDECRSDEVIDMIVRNALRALMATFNDDETIQSGLRRFHNSRDDEVNRYNAEEKISPAAIDKLLTTGKHFLALIRDDDSSSISSNDVVEVSVVRDLSDEDALRRFTMDETSRRAKSRGLERSDFKEIAQKIFNDTDFDATFEEVVPDDYEPDLLNSDNTALYNDLDNLFAMTGNACSQWCKSAGKDQAATSNLLLKIFKQ